MVDQNGPEECAGIVTDLTGNRRMLDIRTHNISAGNLLYSIGESNLG